MNTNVNFFDNVLLVWRYVRANFFDNVSALVQNYVIQKCFWQVTFWKYQLVHL